MSFYVTISLANNPGPPPAVNGTSSTISSYISTIPISTNQTITSNSSLPSSSSTTQQYIPPTSSLNPPGGLNEIMNFLSQNFLYIVIIIGIFFVIVNNFRPTPPVEYSKKKKLVNSDFSLRKYDDAPRKHIIACYLQASKVFEKLGANSDFSLTPYEFVTEVESTFRSEERFWQKFPELTYWYEVARFSESEIPDKAVTEVNEAMDRLRDLIDKEINNSTKNTN
ncbi:MAG: hypothetical protein ACFFD1_13505 [Candidatus Thorarchaeota archaeon]